MHHALKFEKGEEKGDFRGDYRNYLPRSLCGRMIMGRRCQFGPQGELRTDCRMLKLGDRIEKLMPPKSKYGRDEMNWLFRIGLPLPTLPLPCAYALDEL